MDKTIEKLETELRSISERIVKVETAKRDLLSPLITKRGELIRKAVSCGVRKNVVAGWIDRDPVIVSRALKGL